MSNKLKNNKSENKSFSVKNCLYEPLLSTDFNILTHKFKYNVFTLGLIEIFNRNQFIKKKDKTVLVMSPEPNNFVEFVIYIGIKNNFHLNIVSESLNSSNNSKLKSETNSIVSSVENIELDICEWKKTNKTKYDVVFCYQNVDLKRINNGGNMVLFTDNDKEQIGELSKHFKKTSVEYPDLYRGFNQKGTFVVFKGFNEKPQKNSNINKKLAMINKNIENTVEINVKLMMSIKWCINNFMYYVPIADFNDFSNEYYKYIYRMLIVKNIKHDRYPLTIGKNKIKLVSGNVVPMENYELMGVNMKSIETAIDYLDANDYETIGSTLDFFRKPRKLMPIIQNEYGGESVTQAWLKMYEILSIFGQQFFGSMDEVKSFHCCELPGAFIFAMKHYMATICKNKKWDWLAQSLNPEKDKSAFGNQFGLVKKNPDKYDFGNGTGDITSVDNIKYYKGVAKDSNFFTADCGVSHEVRGNLQDKITYSILMFMLIVPKLGSSFVCKLYLPLKNANEVMLFYLIFMHYRRVELFKPKQNVRSTEFYLIGIDKKLEVSKPIETKVMSNKKEFKLSDVPIEFQLDLFGLIKQMCDNYVEQMILKVSYVKLHKHLDKEVIQKLQDEIEKMPKKWITYYGLKKTNVNKRIIENAPVKKNVFNKLFNTK